MKKNITILMIIFYQAYFLSAQTFSGGVGTAASPYQISIKEDIDTIAYYTNNFNNWSVGKHFILTANITNVSATIGTTFRRFAGNFNGGGYTININIAIAYIGGGTGGIGLFANVSNCKIYNLSVTGTISNSINLTYTGGIIGWAYNISGKSEITNCSSSVNITANDRVGGIIGVISGGCIIKNCYSTGSISVIGTIPHVGGIVGSTIESNNDTVHIIRCSTAASSLSAGSHTTGNQCHIGGIIGCTNPGYIFIDSCYNNITTIHNVSSVGTNKKGHIGGILGDNSSEAHITNCTNNTTISSDTNMQALIIGGICGYNNNHVLTIKNCYNYKNISAKASNTNSIVQIGGILGTNKGHATVSHCYNFKTSSGNISADGNEAKAGGIVGDNDSVTSILYIDTCFNYANISGNSKYGLSHVGGILGDNSYGTATIKSCRNAGNINGTGTSRHYDVAGIVGDNMSTLIVKYCTNIGNVEAQTIDGSYSSLVVIGGIVGYGNENVTIEHCHNAGGIWGIGNIGGIIGTMIGGNINHNLNNGNINAINNPNYNIGGIIGLKISGITNTNFYDKQMCIYGGTNDVDVLNQTTGKITEELINTGLQTELGTTYWNYTTNLYPMLYTDTICKIAASPAYLYYTSATNFEKHNAVSNNFTVSTANGIAWTTANNSIISINGTTATINNYGSTQIYPNLGNVKRVVTITSIAPTYKLITRADTLTNGNTTPDSIHSTGNVIITAIPNECYEFIRWDDKYGQPISYDQTTTILLNQDTLLIAIFKRTTKILTLLTNPTDGGTVSGGGEILCNTLDTIIATAESCYKFIEWRDAASDAHLSNDSMYIISINTDKTLIAYFKELFPLQIKVKAQPSYAGTVTGDIILNCPDSTNIITANPKNDCYKFSHWIDSATGTIFSTKSIDTITAYIDFDTNITLIAIFEIDSILISTNINPITAGITMINDGSATATIGCGDNVIISAVPINDCYKFINWTDANGKEISKKETDILVFTENISLTANYIIDTFEISLNANPENFGIVNQGGNFICGTKVIIEAIPNPCKHFVNWTDSATGKIMPYKQIDTITLYENKHLIANFIADTFDLTLSAVPVNSGKLTGQGKYECDSIILIKASPQKDCYTFSYWENTNTKEIFYDSVINVKIIDNMNYIAHFTVKDTFNLIIQAIPNNLNITLYGAGIYSSCDSVATCDVQIFDNCTHFICWTNINGDTISKEINPKIILQNDSIIIAHFSIDSLYVSLVPVPENAGSVNEVEYYQDSLLCNSNFIFEATANYGWKFVNWTDSVTGKIISTNPIDSLPISSDTKLIANFIEGYDSVTITLISNPNNGGILTGDGKYAVGTKVQLSATANTEYSFINWTENGNVLSKNSTFTLTANRNMIIRGNFKDANSEVYIVSLRSNIDNAGILTGDGTYIPNSTANINATNNTGFYFKNWQTEDGKIISNSENFSFKVTSDTDLVANFSLNEYIVSLYANPSYMGNIEGGTSGIYYNGHIFNLKAISNDTTLYKFNSWTNNNGDILSKKPDFKLIVTSDTNIIAKFEMNSEGIIEDKLSDIYVFPNPTTNILNIKIDNYCERNIDIYLTDILGIKMINIHNGNMEIENKTYKIDVSDLQKGTYFINFNFRNKIIIKKIVIN